MDPPAIEAIFQNGETFTVLGLIVVLIIYVYFALTLTILANKTHTPNAWLAWVPLLNLFLMCAVGRRSYAWAFALLIPCINLLALAYVWGGIAEARGRSSAWGLLAIVPGLNLLLPLLLAVGPATGGVTAAGNAQGPVATSTNCPHCRGALAPADAFCGNCGAPVSHASRSPASSPQKAPARRSSGCLAAILVLGCGCVVMIAACGIGGYFLLQPAVYAEPARQPPAIPPGIGGTIAVLPRDSDPTSPASPVSFTSQTFSGPKAGFEGKVRIPSEQLPPGLDAGYLPQVAMSATSAVFQAQPGAPRVNIQVLGTAQNPTAGSQIKDKLIQAIGGISSGVTIENPVGGTFNGTRIEANGGTIYVLTPPAQDVVICIFTAEPSGAATADRLAAALGNGEGIADPQFDPYICVLPAVDPPDLILEQVQGTSGAFPLASATTDPATNAELQQLLEQLQVFVPERVTLANYSDSQSRPWIACICTYGSSSLAWRTWQFVSWVFGWEATGRATASGVSGLVFDNGGERMLIYCKGPYLIFLQGPSDAPVEQFEAFGDSLQL